MNYSIQTLLILVLINVSLRSMELTPPTPAFDDESTAFGSKIQEIGSSELRVEQENPRGHHYIFNIFFKQEEVGYVSYVWPLYDNKKLMELRTASGKGEYKKDKHLNTRIADYMVKFAQKKGIEKIFYTDADPDIALNGRLFALGSGVFNGKVFVYHVNNKDYSDNVGQKFIYQVDDLALLDSAKSLKLTDMNTNSVLGHIEFAEPQLIRKSLQIKSFWFINELFKEKMLAELVIFATDRKLDFDNLFNKTQHFYVGGKPIAVGKTTVVAGGTFITIKEIDPYVELLKLAGEEYEKTQDTFCLKRFIELLEDTKRKGLI